MVTFIEMLCGIMMTLLIGYVWVAYEIWNLSENDSDIGKLTIKEFAMRMYCMHWCLRLFETAPEEQKES